MKPAITILVFAAAMSQLPGQQVGPDSSERNRRHSKLTWTIPPACRFKSRLEEMTT